MIFWTLHSAIFVVHWLCSNPPLILPGSSVSAVSGNTGAAGVQSGAGQRLVLCRGVDSAHAMSDALQEVCFHSSAGGGRM
jgi:hypothetical protein